MAQVSGLTVEKITTLLNDMVVSVRVDEAGQFLYTTKGGLERVGGPVVSPSLAVDKAWPVGSIFTHTSPTNPGTLLGVGTWSRYGQGRVLVGQDDESPEFVGSGNTGGSKTNLLTITNLPAHTHTVPAHSHSFVVSYSREYVMPGGNGGARMAKKVWASTSGEVDSVGATATAGSGVTSSSGQGSPVSNLQPYIVVYMWRRTA